ncbi:MAG: response regulator [Deltaproteobacteria bacterium]|nr:response regulator [Deltaproteobacteria bacterium]
MLETKKFKILVVDDEESVIETFIKNFSDSFNILTATGPEEAEEIIKNRSEEIAIIVSDQKMESKIEGLDFLKKIHKGYSDIIKILITAYSTQNLAIEAVNSGILYQYISKPPKKEVFYQVLLRGYEMFILQREKDFLLKEKTRILNRLIFTDRLRNLTVIAASLSGCVKYSKEALKKFLTVAAIPAEVFSDNIADISSKKKIINKAKQRNKNIFELIEHINKTAVTKDYDYKTYRLNDIIKESVLEVKNSDNVKITSEFDNADYQIKTSYFIMSNLFKNIIEYSINNGVKKILIKLTEAAAINQTEGIKILFKTGVKIDKKNMWNLLPVYFGVFDCMGDIDLIGGSDILISLPLDSDKAIIESADISYFDDLFEQFEVVKFYETYLSSIE